MNRKPIFTALLVCVTLYALAVMILSLFGCKNDTTTGFQQTPPPYPPTYGYILTPELSLNLVLGRYGQANLEYYISKSDFEGFSNYIRTNIIPYLTSLPFDIVHANLSKISTTSSYMNAWLKVIDEHGLLGLIAIRDEFFIKIGE